ncbi:DUF4037 domain-containing protein [Xylanimonas sp. McL0601]|uniref:DUF4037 domain-containing protein n=1 Tax=Xylanimonas sp. McL0601 TaxID=3414739 RepID=UPI003CF2D0F9
MTGEHAADRGGIALAHDYHDAVVRPVLERWCPDVPRAAARVGAGSDVLGVDDAMSRDHDWGLRLQLFVAEPDVARVRGVLERHLPGEFRGHPVRMRFSGSEQERLAVDVSTVAAFARGTLGFDPRDSTTTSDWLSLSGQAALEVVSGEVFEDQTGELTCLRRDLTWYPDDVWRYVVACDWRRLDQELPLMARAGDRGDDLGSRVIAARLVDVAVHLAFTLCRAWTPYPKWRGTVFRTLPVDASVGAALGATLSAATWSERNDALRAALERLAVFQGQVGLPTRTPALVPFFDRPYLAVEPSLVPAVVESIADPAIRALPVGVGTVEQLTDNVDVLVDARRRRAVSGGTERVHDHDDGRRPRLPG